MARAPLKTPLIDRVDQRAPSHTGEMWQQITAQRGRRRSSLFEPLKNVRIAMAVVCLICLGGYVGQLVAGHGAATAPAVLALTNGSTLPERVMPTERYEALDFNDGSRITVARNAHVDMLTSSAGHVALALRAGRARFDIRPKGPRSWRIECGLATVEVVGTGFVLERNADELSVEVFHGAVLVRGPQLVDGVERLGPGQRIVLRKPSVARGALRGTPEAPYKAALDRGANAISAELSEPAAAPNFALAPEDTRGPKAATDAPPAGAKQLFEAADRARREGRMEVAAQHLTRIMDQRADPNRAALAAFTLARLELGQLKQPQKGPAHLRRALALGLPKGLAAEALLMLVEAELARGNMDGACNALHDYPWDPAATTRTLPDMSACETSEP